MEWQEHEMISWLKDRFSCCLGKVCGIGDDAAYVCGDVVWSVDTCVEHVHFRRQWIAQGIVSWETIGRRAAISALSDIAAMGAKAKGMLSAGIFPNGFLKEDFKQIYEGYAKACEENSTMLLGGNISWGGECSLTTSVLGETSIPLFRDGAKQGQGIYVTGPPGDAGLGLYALVHGIEPNNVQERYFMDRWKYPRAHLEEGNVLAKIAGACIDLSDSLEKSIREICEASNVGAMIEVGSIPKGKDFEAIAKKWNLVPDELLVKGGESYALLFTAYRDPGIGTQIGTITSNKMIVFE